MFIKLGNLCIKWDSSGFAVHFVGVADTCSGHRVEHLGDRIDWPLRENLRAKTEKTKQARYIHELNKGLICSEERICEVFDPWSCVNPFRPSRQMVPDGHPLARREDGQGHDTDR